MTVQSIMSSRLFKVRPTDTVSYALNVMHQNHIRNLPVVDEHNHFSGLFGVRQVIRLLLPKAAQIKGGLQDLSFMPDQLDDLFQRLEVVGNEPVINYLEDKQNLLFCGPDTPFPEVLELLRRSFNTSLPVIVVEDNEEDLVGMVSAWDVLDMLMVNGFVDRGSSN